MSSNYMTTDDIALVSAGLDLSTVVTAVYAPGRPQDISRIILVTQIAQTVADANITVGVRNVDDTSSVTKGSFVLPLSGSALNKVLSIPLVKPKATATVNVDQSIGYKGYSPGGFIRVNPGQELFMTSDGGGSTGTYAIYVEYKDQGFSGADVAAAQELVFTGV